MAEAKQNSSSSSVKKGAFGRPGRVGVAGGAGGGNRHRRKIPKDNKKPMTVVDAADLIPNLTIARIGRQVEVRRIDVTTRVWMKNEAIWFVRRMLHGCRQRIDKDRTNKILMRYMAAECQEHFPFLMHIWTRNQTYEEPARSADLGSDEDPFRAFLRFGLMRQQEKAGNDKSTRRSKSKSNGKSSSRSRSKKPSSLKKDPVPAAAGPADAAEDVAEQSGTD